MMAAAAGNSSDHKHGAQKHDSHFRRVVSKRKALEKQESTFASASEETIMREYQKLRRAHQDFLATFKEAKRAYFNDSPTMQLNESTEKEYPSVYEQHIADCKRAASARK
ncbi:MAG: hypothetical protein JXR73_05435 [Candidatus Omnitrophica bacterium]|nr:hypothetical protein [Candidatus Omnitrophota bacterium]